MFLRRCLIVYPVLLFFHGKIKSQMLWQFNKDTVISWYYAGGDEFNATRPDTTQWDYWYGWSRSIFSQKEQQYYTDGKNHVLNNGSLNIFALKKDTLARMVDWLPDNDSLILDDRFYGFNKQVFHYTSGMLQSRQSYQYGYFEIKFRMPEEKGYWPAFWLYGGTPNEEIDWMELKTEKPHAIHVGRHSKNRDENKMPHGFRKKWWGDWVQFKGNLSQGYHIIAGEWNKDYVKYFLNGECIAFSKVSLPEAKFLCVNLAVPGKDGSFRPAPDDKDNRPCNFEIDYIRVWSSDRQQAIPFPETQPGDQKKINDTISVTRLRSKSKFLYGKRADHKTEGFTLSLIPLGNGMYNLQALGKDIPPDARFFYNDGYFVGSSVLTYGMNLFSTGKKKTTLTVECYGRKLSYIITP